MYFTSLFALSAVVAGVIAAPYYPFPLPDGFPKPSPAQLAIIEKEAQGTLPNSPLPKSIKSAGITTLQLLALNELFEVAYFTDLLTNITNNVPGYDAASIAPLDRQYVIDSITAVVNQEKLHALGVNAALTNTNHTAIEPCKYQFPPTTFLEAITLAATFTDVVLGTLPEAQTLFGIDGGDETPLVNLFGSVLAQEGEQVGFFRFTQKKTPSAAPFLTGGSPAFAFSALQLFIVPNSCPQPLSAINIPSFSPLNVLSQPQAKNSTLEYSVMGMGKVSSSANSVVYISGQNLPVTVPITDVAVVDGVTGFKASFPFESGFANGLTIAAVVKEVGKAYATPDAVAAATVYGPGLIEVG